MADSASFSLLDERIQRFIWMEGWEELRDAQERAIPAIVSGAKDVIIAAATAAGKTEAAFFPILTNLLRNQAEHNLVIYISPLKALINDQFGRLERLCSILEIDVWPWHGDISSSAKANFLKKPSGVLLITPESLEATFCNRGSQVERLFAGTRYIVVDELHAFIGSERGKQLQSLMHRLEVAVQRKICRIGLSATLGDMSLAGHFLRPRGSEQVEIVDSKSDGRELKLLIKGYEEPAVVPVTQVEDVATDGRQPEGLGSSPVEVSIARHLFSVLQGTNNLVFPNSRAKVEKYTYLLRRLCEEARIPNEFWPHHGSLSKEIRTDTEAALKAKDRPANAICTNTLELGIDIGAVKSIAQIGSPPSVASLRQRLGRSGRRKGEPAILRGYCVEQQLDSRSQPLVQLRCDTFELIAMISLLLENWFEPPATSGAHLSTLTQQLLSLIAQRGGVGAAEAYRTLCVEGPFENISKDQFAGMLREFGRRELLQQESSGILLHARIGEKLVNHYTFYAAFASEEEFRVIAGSRLLGSLPITVTIQPNDLILFAGKTWRIESVDEEGKAIYVVRHKGGRAPAFGGSGGVVHDKVRQRMRALYEEEGVPNFLDTAAKTFVSEGRAAYRSLALSRNTVYRSGRDVLLFTWLGDKVNEAIAMLLKRGGFTAFNSGPAIELIGVDASRLRGALSFLQDVGDGAMPLANELLLGAKNLQREKWDWALPDDLLQLSYSSLHLDIAGAHNWLKTFAADEQLTQRAAR